MKTQVRKPFIGRIVQDDGRVQWYVMWRGEEYAKYNTYEAAEKDRANLVRIDDNQRG